MKWLVTFPASVDLAAANALLTAHGATVVAADDIITMGDSEWVAAVRGPAELPRTLQNNVQVRGVYPSSDLTFYDPP